MTGNDIKALEDFRQRYDFCFGALEPSETRHLFGHVASISFIWEPQESSKDGTCD